LFLGLTSLFTDVSSEMLTSVLPLYFMLELGMTPLQFGVIDGLYQGASAVVRVAAGLMADAGRRYKQVAVLGYALSTVCKGGLLLANGAWLPLTGLLMIDRLGKGIRTAPRDSLITLSSDRARLGEAFGVHRAMDTVGAVMGPVLAFGVLALAPRAYDAVFVASLAFALIGVAIIVLFVENLRQTSHHPPAPAFSRQRLTETLANPRFRTLVLAGTLLGMMTITDALVYMLLQRKGAVPSTFFPLLFVGTSTAYLLLAVPFGRLADRIGRHRLFLAGHVMVIGLYAMLLASSLSNVGIVMCVTLLGVYYAATDGVLSALASTVLDAEQITAGLALVATAVAVARLLAAALFGAIWEWRGPEQALIGFGLVMTVVTLIAAKLLHVGRHWTPGALPS
jgi:MFS family permease